MNGRVGRRSRERVRQCELAFGGRGGKRAGAGRPETNPEAESHARRAPLSRHHPVHVTLRVRRGLPRLRDGAAFRALRRAFASGCERPGFRLVHFSVQGSHVHLIAEGDDRRSFVSGLRGLGVRIARGLNRLWRRSGQVLGDRPHEHVLATPIEVRRALVYVLQNARKHGSVAGPPAADPLSSGPWFDGWRAAVERAVGAPPVARARSWLLRSGWRRRGARGARGGAFDRMSREQRGTSCPGSAAGQPGGGARVR
jgi:REP element-mobilizing transposase RayT